MNNSSHVGITSFHFISTFCHGREDEIAALCLDFHLHNSCPNFIQKWLCKSHEWDCSTQWFWPKIVMMKRWQEAMKRWQEHHNVITMSQFWKPRLIWSAKICHCDFLQYLSCVISNSQLDLTSSNPTRGRCMKKCCKSSVDGAMMMLLTKKPPLLDFWLSWIGMNVHKVSQWWFEDAVFHSF